MSGQVSTMDLATKRTVSSVPGGKFPDTVALSKDGTKFYVSNWGREQEAGAAISQLKSLV